MKKFLKYSVKHANHNTGSRTLRLNATHWLQLAVFKIEHCFMFMLNSASYKQQFMRLNLEQGKSCIYKQFLLLMDLLCTDVIDIEWRSYFLLFSVDDFVSYF